MHICANCIWNNLLVMSKLVTVLRYTVCRTTRTKPVFHASFTRWPFPTRKTDFVSLPITVEMSISRVISRGTPSSAALSIITRSTDLFPHFIAGVVSPPVIPRDTLHSAALTIPVSSANLFSQQSTRVGFSWDTLLCAVRAVVVLVAVYLEVKCQLNNPALMSYGLFLMAVVRQPRFIRAKKRLH